MSQKFLTTNPKNFMGQNPEVIPDWMANVADNLKIKDTYVGDWDTESRGVFAEYHPTVQRQNADFSAEVREITQSYSVQKLKNDAKIALAKFLTGKYYVVKNAVAGNDFATLQVTLNIVPTNFIFPFEVKNGKLVMASTFLVEDNIEYPFSRAGLEECLSDIKTGSLKTTKKAESLGKTYLINKEEVVRRYNGSLRETTDMISKRLEEGAIVGVGSNTYASFFDVDQLFPQQEKTMVEHAPEFEFVKNAEHVTMNPHKSAQVLSLDAIRILAGTFTDVSVVSSYRDNNELLVAANVLNGKTGLRTYVSFSFEIENETLGGVRFCDIGEKRLGIRQLIEELSSNTSEVLAHYLEQTKIASQRINSIILSRRDVKNKLHKVVDPAAVDKIIDKWIQTGLAQPLNSTTFSTQYTFEELLAHSNQKPMSRAAMAKLGELEQHFGEGLDVDVEQNKPLDKVRLIEDAEVSDETRMLNFIASVRSMFKDFVVNDYTRTNENTYNVTLMFTSTNGTDESMVLNVNFDGSKLKEANAVIQGKNVPIQRLAAAFKSSPLLRTYLQNGGSIEVGPMVISTHSLRARLATLIHEQDIDNVINYWVQNGSLKNIGNDLLASKESFQNLLNKTSANILTADEMQEIAEVKKFFGDDRRVKADYDKDTGVQNIQVHITDEQLFQKANARLAQEFKYYKPVSFNKDDDNYILRVQLANEDTGLRHNIDFIFHFDDDNITACYMRANGRHVQLASVKKTFALSEALSQYLSNTGGKHHAGPMIIKVAEFARRMQGISHENPTDVLQTLASKGLISYVDSETVASQHSFEELIQASNVVVLSNVELEKRITRSAREHGLMLHEAYVQDTGERRVEESAWSAQRLNVYAQAQIGNVFKDFELLDAEVVDDVRLGNVLTVSARFINPFSGLRETVAFHYGLNNGRPNGVATFTPSGHGDHVASINELGDYLMSLGQGNEAVAQFTAIHGSAERSQKSIISKGSLENQLRAVVASENIPEVINTLVRLNVLKPLSNASFACEYTMSELVNQLTKLQKINLRAGREQMLLAVRDERKINMSPEYHVKETDTRTLDNNGSQITTLFANTKQKISTAIDAALQAKRITSNKKEQLLSNLEKVNSINEIQAIVNELKRYFK